MVKEKTNEYTVMVTTEQQTLALESSEINWTRLGLMSCFANGFGLVLHKIILFCRYEILQSNKDLLSIGYLLNTSDLC